MPPYRTVAGEKTLSHVDVPCSVAFDQSHADISSQAGCQFAELHLKLARFFGQNVLPNYYRVGGFPVAYYPGSKMQRNTPCSEGCNIIILYMAAAHLTFYDCHLDN